MDLKVVIISSILFVLIDSIYLSTFSKYFNGLITRVQGKPIKLDIYSAILCYIFLVFGLNYFILRENRSPLDAFIFGIVVYGVYETTTKAIIEKWEYKAVALDTLWGGILFASTTYFTNLLMKIKF